MEDNILNSGQEGLKELKDKLIQLDRYQNGNSGLHSDEKKLEKSINSKEKSIEDEINQTIKKRKDEIETTYNQEAAKAKGEIAKVQDKKERSKSAQKSERIEIETADLADEYEQMDLSIRNKLKSDKVPKLVNTNLFYALYMPKGGIEYGIIAIALLIVLLALPCGIYFLILPEQQVTYLIIIYVLTVIIFGGIYVIIGTKIKDKHLSSIKEIRVIRTNMTKNKKKRDKIRKRILKDEDESSYALEHYDNEISKIEAEIEVIEKRKQEAINVFDTDTKSVIVNEIRGQYSDTLLNMNTQLIEMAKNIKDNDENIRYLSLELVENYEAYLGKEFMSVEKIDQLISTMNEKGLENVSQALAVIKTTK